MFSLIRKRVRGGKGFTLIELLVVIIIIAILAAIAIPTFLGQRTKAQDTNAKALVRNAMTAIESAYVDLRTFDPEATVNPMTVDELGAIEPSITFIVLDTASTAPTASADADAVNYTGTDTRYEVGTLSSSGTTFGVEVVKEAGGGNTFFVDDASEDW